MTIAIASDLSGFPLKENVVKHLKERGFDIIDFGIEDTDHPQPYFIQAPKVCKAIQEGKAEKGILVCGTGQGMAIVANKHKGIYACVADSVFSGERATIINRANVLTMGGWITAPFVATEIVDGWLDRKPCEKMEFKTEFLTNAYNKVLEIEKENLK